MVKQSKKTSGLNRRSPLNSSKYFWKQFCGWWNAKWWHKIATVLLTIVLLFTGTTYSIAQWYIWTQRGKPTQIGATFISAYAEYLGVDPQETLHAMIYDLGVSRLRLVSYWDKIEPTPGTYDFSDLDWQFKMAEEAKIPISLAVGLRQPRWPECHMPTWAKTEPRTQWEPQLRTFMTAVINRYKNSPQLDSYQLENEFFLTVFGKCTDFDRQRLIDEAKLVKDLDRSHTLIISRSNNIVGLPLYDPQPDLFGVSVYKRVWDKTFTHRYLEYPLPAWFYAFLAGGGKIATGKDLMIHELQAEAWTPENAAIKDAPVEELYNSMDPVRLKHRIGYGKGTGMKTIDLWGVEWWYQMKVKRGEPGLWNAAKVELQATKARNITLME